MSLTSFYKPLLLQREVIKRGGKCSLNKNIRNSQEKNLKPKLTSYSNLTKFLFIQFITLIFKFVSVDKKKCWESPKRNYTRWNYKDLLPRRNDGYEMDNYGIVKYIMKPLQFQHKLYFSIWRWLLEYNSAVIWKWLWGQESQVFTYEQNTTILMWLEADCQSVKETRLHARCPGIARNVQVWNPTKV